MRDLTVVAHTVVDYTVTEYTTATMVHTASDCTAITVKKTKIVAQTVVAVVVQIVAIVVAVPPAVIASSDCLLPSCSTCPLFCPGEIHILNNPYLHSQQIDRTCNTNSSAS